MKQFITTLLLCALMGAGKISAQQQITQGTRLPVLTTTQRDQMPVDNLQSRGLIIYNSDINCIEYWNGNEWISLCGGVIKSQVAIDCDDVVVHGIYMESIPLNTSNFLSMIVNVTKDGAYTITATTDNGYGFYLSGIFLNPGLQKITLPGQGTPIRGSAGDIVHITINGSTIGYTCTSGEDVIIPVTYAPAPKSILAMGNSAGIFSSTLNGTFGYSANASISHNMLMAPINFGTLPNSTVQVLGFTMQGICGDGFVPIPGHIPSRPTAATLRTGLATSPDIVIIGWGMIYDDDMIAQFIDYLNAGGVMIIMNKFSTTTDANLSEAPFFRSLFGEPGIRAHIITDQRGRALGSYSNWGSLFRLTSIPGDPILNGPFGDLNGLLWGVDYSPAAFMSGIPESQIITYSGANNATGGTNTGVTMFRHATLNLFWVGDGGFLSNDAEFLNPPQFDIMPFAINDANQPVPRTGFGSTVATGGISQTVHNSQLFANVLAWAIQQAENNGINSR